MRTDKLNIKMKSVLGELPKKAIIKLLFPFRNTFILFNISNRAKKNEVNLDYWSESKNLGDALAPVIVNHMLELKGLNPRKQVSKTKHLYAVGSVLTAGIQDATVWGSGILNPKLLYRLGKRSLDIRSVRGPVTMMLLRDYGFEVPAVYGDPAILMTEIYYPEYVDKKHKYGLITHKDYVLQEELSDLDIVNIDICTDNYKKFVDELCSVEIVISSSLHGIILAESYGIPAILLKPHVDLMKYYDYYMGTGRLSFPIANSVYEATTINPIAPPNLSEMRYSIKNVFPYDIYE